jgi:aminopeptidase N
LIPTYYELWLKPDIYTHEGPPFAINGRVEITVHCLNRTDMVVLHAKDLKIDTITLFDQADMEQNITQVHFDNATDFIIIKTENLLYGVYRLCIHFSGVVEIDHKVGVKGQALLVVPYKSTNGTER